MSTAKMMPKGQVTISSSVQTESGIGTGSRIEFFEIENGQFVIVPSVSPFHSLKGMIRKSTTPVSIEQMNLAIASQGAKAE